MAIARFERKVFGDLDGVEETLGRRGRVYRCKIDKSGARTL